MVFQVASPLGAIDYAGTSFGQVIVGSAQAVAALPGALPKLFAKDRRSTAAGQVSSVVGAAEATGAAVAANVGWQYKVSFVLLLIASLNIFVGAFNMLPLLPLDGGHIAMIIYERIRAWLARLRGRPDPGLVDIAKLLPVSFSLFAVLIVLQPHPDPGRHRQPASTSAAANRASREGRRPSEGAVVSARTAAGHAGGSRGVVPPGPAPPPPPPPPRPPCPATRASTPTRRARQRR